jgi:TonB family protein
MPAGPRQPQAGDGSPQSSFTTRAQLTFKERAWVRFAGAVAVAVVALAVLILLGPERDEIRRRFEVYGAEGEIHLMPEISIEKGQDVLHQLPASLSEPPPPNYEIEPDEPDAQAEKEVPLFREESPEVTETESVTEVVDADAGERDQVELTLPQQTSRDFRILELVRPLYPAAASAAQRAVPVIRVDAAIFVGTDGTVQAAMVTGGDGAPVFDEAVLAAVRQWRFQWLTDPPPQTGRWIEMTWRFKSPTGGDRFRGSGSSLPTGRPGRAIDP